MRRRTRARRLALEVLYQVDLLSSAEVVDEALTGPTAPADAPSRQFARELVLGVVEHRDDIDRLIREAAENWELHRMATVDRNILRLGTFELVYRRDIPPKVSINEAVELAKRYSTAESGNFVNGILDRIKSGLAPDAKDQPEARTDPVEPKPEATERG